MWHFSLHVSNIGPVYCQLQGLKVSERQIVNHMLPFMSLSLFVSSLGRSGTHSNGHNRSPNKGSSGILSTALTARSSCGNVRQG